MPGWLRTAVGKAANSVVTDSLVDRLHDSVSEQLLSGSSENQNLVALDKLRATGRECQEAARETIEICNATSQKREQVIAFGEEIKSTLLLLNGNNNDASIVEVIKDLTEGSKVQAAKELAEGLDEAALACVDKSIRMIDLMEDGMDSLPAVVKKAIETAAEAADDDGDDDDQDDNVGEILKGVDQDIQDVKSCIDAIQDLNLVTAIKVGLDAFCQLTDKAKRSRDMFESIRGFADDVQESSKAISEMDVVSMASNAKNMLHCLQMTESMRVVAEGAGRLIKVLIGLFEATSERISALWAALAFAKECMTDSLAHVTEAKQLCMEARDKSTSLIEKSLFVKDQFEAVGEINAQSIAAVRDLSDGDEIRQAIDLARNMDDLVLECSGKVAGMVDRVTEAFGKLPSILTEGIVVTEEGKQKDDPAPANVEDDITELNASRQAIEEANLLSATRAAVNGFSGVSGKASVCKDMLQSVEGFASSCETTVAQFNSVWDLESTKMKVREMCRLVSLGELMKQFAEQIKRLIDAIIALMTASIKKFSSVSLDDIAGDITGEIGDAVDMVKDKLNFFRR